MFPMALATGNTFIMKPSEQDPGAAMLLCEMAMECGVPAGVLNVIHGTKPGMLTTLIIFLYLIGHFEHCLKNTFQCFE